MRCSDRVFLHLARAKARESSIDTVPQYLNIAEIFVAPKEGSEDLKNIPFMLIIVMTVRHNIIAKVYCWKQMNCQRFDGPIAT